MHTWCALDAVGIPAALELDATARTECGSCGTPITVELIRGVPADDRELVLWLPTGPCDNVREQFCPTAHLFCDRGHLDAWHQRTGKPTGDVLSVEGAADLGRQAWNRDQACSDAWPNG